ncbi:MAG: alpha/beta fold hydrolase [Sphingomonadaceae bacterium]|nr:alpha/beta fold hydrolase [Sphingomonadaceae bacterium]MCP5383784.1 alpha/beta fold hydrolase [Altererythrobacter sp.]MCP5392009.1 alpha/beta fold hydrolase [Sphingomonadaceae bacterium]MCP5394328.1 alpha/beta fold hydrolase [Sphingomonadaceae bacterium]
MKSAEVSLETIGGRTLRVARWRLDKPSEHPPILFFNGIGANIEAVAPLAEALDDRGFIMFDMPGIGGSPDPVVPYNTVTMAWTASQLLDRFGLDVVDVMGISWGGGMAQHFAIQHPGRTRRLVLIATSAGMLMMPGSPKALTKMANPRRYIDPDFMVQNFETLYGEGLGKGPGKKGHMSRLTPPSPRGYMYQLLAMLGWTSAPALPFMRKSTLILMGDDDAIVPLVNGKFLASLIPNSRLAVMEGGGHLFLLSHKDESIAEIRAHLDPPINPELKEAA